MATLEGGMLRYVERHVPLHVNHEGGDLKIAS